MLMICIKKIVNWDKNQNYIEYSPLLYYIETILVYFPLGNIFEENW